MSDTAATRASARERTQQIDALRTEIIRMYSQRGDTIGWEALRELITSATLSAEEPFEHSGLEDRQRTADAAFERLTRIVKAMRP